MSDDQMALKNLQPIYATILIKQMVWLCWKTLHLTILINRTVKSQSSQIPQRAAQTPHTLR